MLHLLKLEWLKQKDYALFRLLVIAYLVFLPAVLFVGKKIDFGNEGPFNPQTQFFHFPSIWGWLGYIGNWMSFFILGFMAVLMITNEYTNRTLRQNVITGLQREGFFTSKILFMAVVALAATMYYAACALVIGLMHVDDTLYFSTVFKNVELVPRFWLMSMSYMSFGLLIGLLVKRTGIALFLYLAYALVVETILRWVIHLYFFKNISMSMYPMNAAEDLVPNPAVEFVFDTLQEQGFRVLLTPWEAVLITSVYVFLFLFLSYRKLKNSDL